MSFSLREAKSATDGAPAEAAAAHHAAARAAEAALERAQAKLSWVDDVFSTWKPQSPVSRLRRGEIELATAPPEVAEVLELCRTARDVSEGWFDPWNLPGGLDPTGLVKGWAAERALDELKKAGVPAALINAGGDIAAYGRPAARQPWRIGIRHPLAEDRLLLMVELDGPGAVATSGTYERGEHLIDPHTGAPAHGLLSATVVGLDLAFADALATALFVSGGALLERISRLAGYHGFTVSGDGLVRATRGLPVALKIAA
ncbi:MAG: FAD:protein FMN transferase [Actinobacteria bacterium]|nr:FAD:protein FMN transferase [Actinomycetota bacterium]